MSFLDVGLFWLYTLLWACFYAILLVAGVVVFNAVCAHRRGVDLVEWFRGWWMR